MTRIKSYRYGPFVFGLRRRTSWGPMIFGPPWRTYVKAYRENGRLLRLEIVVPGAWAAWHP